VNLHSFFELDCANCGEKIRTASKNAECPKCGVTVEIESWQVQHTLTPDGLLIRNPLSAPHPDRSGAVTSIQAHDKEERT
jgi:hypothetical protein